MELNSLKVLKSTFIPSKDHLFTQTKQKRMVCILVYFKLHCAHLVFTKADIKSQFQLTNLFVLSI